MDGERAVVVRVPRWRPGKKFVAWVRSYTIHRLHQSIGVTRGAIYQWIRGENPPREDNARAILLLSARFPEGVGALTYEDIYGRVEGA